MTVHIFRVTVRGHFADLDERSRSALLASAEEHDIFRSAFTPEGTFVYERNLVAFSFRFEVRVDSDDLDGTGAAWGPEALRSAVIERTIGRVEARMRGWGFGHKPLRADAVDMADVWSDDG